MSTSDPQDSPPLTRRQLRELRETGVNPVVTPAGLDDEPVADTPSAQEPVPDPVLPAPQRPLTRREIRARAAAQQEAVERPAEPPQRGESVATSSPTLDDESPAPIVNVESPVEPGEAEVASITPDEITRAAAHWPDSGGDASDSDSTEALHPALGQNLALSATEAQSGDVSFDELITVPDTTGSSHLMPTALIFSSSTGAQSLSGPLEDGGDLVVTSSYAFPTSMGSQGHVPGTTDGKDIDAALLDHELSSSSSPAPVAASSAISTIKPAGEVMRQPTPEKSGKAVMVLSIIAGVIGVVLSGALVLAFMNGVF